MLPKVIAHMSLLLIMTSFVSSAKFPEYCKDCEEEVWEEVPCDEVVATTSTTTTPAPLITCPPVIATTTPPPPKVTTASPPKLSSIEVIPPLLPPLPALQPPLPPAPYAASYKKCYCECKDGCREFCRKTLVNPNLKKQITQVSKTAQSTPDGLIEVQHLHQRNFVPTTYEPAPVPAPGPVPAPAPAPIYVPTPAPIPAPPARSYNTKPYIQPLPPASAPGGGTLYPVESSAEIDNICGGNSPSYNNPSYPAPEKPTKYYSNPAIDFSNYNTIDDLAQLLRSASYSNPGSIFYPPSSPNAPSAPAAPNSYSSNSSPSVPAPALNNYPSYPPPPPNSYPSYPSPPNSYSPYPQPPPAAPPKVSKYSTPPKFYKRPPIYGKVPESNSPPSSYAADAAATASIRSPTPDPNCASCSEPKLNGDIDGNLGNYFKDYLVSSSDTEGDYPAYQLTYPISI